MILAQAVQSLFFALIVLSIALFWQNRLKASGVAAMVACLVFLTSTSWQVQAFLLVTWGFYSFLAVVAARAENKDGLGADLVHKLAFLAEKAEWKFKFSNLILLGIVAVLWMRTLGRVKEIIPLLPVGSERTLYWDLADHQFFEAIIFGLFLFVFWLRLRNERDTV